MTDAERSRELAACCHDDARLAYLFDRPMTLTEILTRRDSSWVDVPAINRLRVFFRTAPRSLQMVVANRAADRQVRAHCLHCGHAVVERWATHWLSNEDRSQITAWAIAADWATTPLLQATMRAAAAVMECQRATSEAAVAAACQAVERIVRIATNCWATAEVVVMWIAKEAEAARRAEREAQLVDAIQVLTTAETSKEKS